MSESEILSLRIESKILDQVKELYGNRQVSKFIRDAIKEKLNIIKKEQEEIYHRIKKIDTLDTVSINKTANNIEFNVKLIYEEIKKQNEILKLILRRATFASGSSIATFKEIIKDKKRFDSMQEQIKEILESDYKNFEENNYE